MFLVWMRFPNVWDCMRMHKCLLRERSQVIPLRNLGEITKKRVLRGQSHEILQKRVLEGQMHEVECKTNFFVLLHVLNMQNRPKRTF